MVNAEVAEVEVVEAVEVDDAEVDDVDVVEVVDDDNVDVVVDGKAEGEAEDIKSDCGLGRGRRTKRKTNLFKA